MMTFPTKDPDAVLAYTHDWTGPELDVDTIAESTWTVPAGLTANSDTNDATSVTIWLSGGTAGKTYTLTNTVVTAGHRTLVKHFALPVRER